MRANSWVKINFSRVRKLTQAQITALEQTTEVFHTEVIQEQVMPRDTGNLQNESTFIDYGKVRSGRVVIVSSTPYARRLYFHPEYHFNKEENPNAKGKWYGDWIPGGKKDDFCEKIYIQNYKRITGV